MKQKNSTSDNTVDCRGSDAESYQQLLDKYQILEEKYNQLRQVIDQLPVRIYWKDAQGTVMGFNKAQADHTTSLHSQPIEMMGKNVIEIFHELDYDEHEARTIHQNSLDVIQSGVATIIEETIINNRNKTEYCLSYKVPQKNSQGEVTGLIGLSVDITERKKLEISMEEAKRKAEIANEVKSNFLATMSHELRTPMNAIIGIAQILGTKSIPPKQKELVDIIFESGKHLLYLIEDILDFATIEAGELEIVNKPFNLHSLLNEIKVSMFHLLEKKQIELITDYNKNTPEIIMGDPKRIRQIVVNLLGNAIKFTLHGYIRLTINSIKKANNETYISVAVADTGIGIPKNKLDQIFERFTQVESRYSRRFEGTGLGLAITKQLLKHLKGTITVKSTLGKGSTFEFVIPYQIPSHEKINYVIEQNETKYEVHKKLNFKILLVEDNELNQLVAKSLLEDLGCSIEIANHGMAAISMYKDNEYDFIFMDIGLPDMSGIQVIKKIRQLSSNKPNIPIVAMTAHALPEDQENCKQAGANDVLHKPIIQEKLRAVIIKWVKETTEK